MVTGAGCASHSTSETQGQAAAAVASAAASASAGDAQTAATTDLPVYPGATMVPTRLAHDMSLCGRKLKLVSYHVAADAHTVASWYKDHTSGATLVDLNNSTNDANITQFEVLDANGGNAAIVMQMHFSNAKLAAAAKTLDADKTSIGIETFDPPFGQEYVALMSQATSNDPSAVQAAKAKLGTMCPKE